MGKDIFLKNASYWQQRPMQISNCYSNLVRRSHNGNKLLQVKACEYNIRLGKCGAAEHWMRKAVEWLSSYGSGSFPILMKMLSGLK
jgi:hypothetical protein